MSCDSCAADVAPDARFCPSCGAPQASPDRPSDTRKHATILFADIAGSTTLGETLDPESVRSTLAEYFGVARAVLERHGGTVEKFIGDAVMAVFGVPQVHEDDALRAVRAALELQRAVGGLNARRADSPPLAIRIGVQTGEVVVGQPGSATLVTGDPVNTAARLEQAAEPGTIVIGEPTMTLVRDAVDAERLPQLLVRGKAHAVTAYRLRDVHGDEGRLRRLTSAMLGRDVELEQLRAAWRDTRASRESRLITVVAPAGTGKSRLVRAFAESPGAGARVLFGRCLPYGDGITYWPIREMLYEAAGVVERDTTDDVRIKLKTLVERQPDADVIADRLLGALGLNASGAASQLETFWAIRRTLEGLAQDAPVVALVEDLHWAEPTLLDLVEYVRDMARAPVLLVATARPELFEVRPTWGATSGAAVGLRLEPLDASTVEALIDAQPGGTAVQGVLRRRITDAAEGNPLYVEEMVALLREAGALRASDRGWELEEREAAFTVPPSVGALLAARLERLPEDELLLMERASVAGRTFESSALAHLAPPRLRRRIGGLLLSLVRKELVRPEAGELTASDAFRFRHVLIRDAAYERLAKRDRAELHERFADWLIESAGRRLPELEEIVGYHLAEAAGYLDELGGDGGRRGRARSRAAEHLRAAGRAAWARRDMSATLSLLERSTTLAGEDDAERAHDLFTLMRAAWASGDAATSEQFLSAAERAADTVGDDGLLLRIRLRRAANRHMRATGSHEELRRTAEAVYEAANRLNDRSLMSAALVELGALAVQAGRPLEEFSLLERALALAESGDDPHEARSVRYLIANRLFQIPIEPAKAERRAREMLAQYRHDRSLAAVLLITLAALAGHAERFGEARDLLREARAIAEELGMLVPVLAADWAGVAATVELLAGEPGQAESIVREFVQVLIDARDNWHLSGIAGLLAGSMLRQRERLTPERVDDIERWIEVARGASDPADAIGEVAWRLPLARMLSVRGEHERAVEVAGEAVASVAVFQVGELEADALLDYAVVLAGAGRTREAVTAAERARSVASSRSRALAAAAGRLLDELTAEAPQRTASAR